MKSRRVVSGLEIGEIIKRRRGVVLTPPPTFTEREIQIKNVRSDASRRRTWTRSPEPRVSSALLRTFNYDFFPDLYI